MLAHKRIIIDLQGNNLQKVMETIETLAGEVWGFRVGLELITSVGTPRIMEYILNAGAHTLYDGKFNTDDLKVIQAASRAISELNATMFTILATGGEKVIKSAIAEKGTSLVLADLSTYEKVLIDDIKKTDCDGILCPSKELEFFNRNDPSEAKLRKVAYNIIPKWYHTHKHDIRARSMTPAEALKAGADYLIFDGVITNPPNGMSPLQAVKRITEEIEVA